MLVVVEMQDAEEARNSGHFLANGLGARLRFRTQVHFHATSYMYVCICRCIGQLDEPTETTYESFLSMAAGHATLLTAEATMPLNADSLGEVEPRSDGQIVCWLVRSPRMRRWLSSVASAPSAGRSACTR